MTLASYAAIVCSIGFLWVGWLLKGWDVEARKRREDAEREREFEAIVRLAREEDAEAAGRSIDYFDAASGVVRRIRWDGPALTSFQGGEA